MKVKTFIGGFDNNLSYLLWCEKTRLAALVDTSVEPLEILEFIESEDLILEKILITHTHHDHIKYISDFKYKFPIINILLHPNPINKIGSHYSTLEHNEVICVGKHLLTTLHTPGHFSDSICFWNKEEGFIFTGDTVFIGRTGRTIGSNSSIQDLYKSVYKVILSCPHETIIYPGHHYGYKPYDTIDSNIKNSSFFQCSNFNEFKKVMEKFEKSKNNNK
ncbi:MAG: hypothetical protein CMG00_08880 [Candidatus Marinimicrobia bacterium]|nr:hypothetical protein [Candidatus Neomarinimicrobiota bacterium]|tara:strand:- start:1199 stop:1855 length:657 start_codon:yes stop_codon:yes gene_type:complete